MNNSIHLVDYFPDFATENGLFQRMVAQGAPWPLSVGEAMDRAYFTMYSGIKNPSQFVKLNMAGDVANTITIAAILFGIYGDVWKRLWDSYKTQYNPIQNYNIDETIGRTSTNDRTITRTGSATSSVDGTEKTTTQDNGTQGTVGTNTNNVVSDESGTSTVEHGLLVTKDAEADNYTYGFNSPDKVPTGVVIEHGTDQDSGTDTTTTTGHSTSDNTGSSKVDVTISQTGESDTATTSAREDKSTEDTVDDSSIKEDITRQRSGNVGQNSYQELLSQEFQLWSWNYFMRVFEDCDRFLVLSVYNSCNYSSFN